MKFIEKNEGEKIKKKEIYKNYLLSKKVLN